jgi:hypothetical protein
MPKITLSFVFACLLVASDFGQSAKGYAARFNENAAYRVVGQIVTAQYAFQSTLAANGEFASTLEQLTSAGLLDQSLSSGEKYGYRFNVAALPATPQSGQQFIATATPSQFPKTGRKSFYTDQRGLIHAADIGGAVATVNQPEFVVCGINESLIIPSFRAILSSEGTYSSAVGAGNYANLTQLRVENLIGSILASGQICGYTITVRTVLATQTTAPSYSIHAIPQSYPNTGNRSFYATEAGIIHGADKQGLPANANDPPVIQ